MNWAPPSSTFPPPPASREPDDSAAESALGRPPTPDREPPALRRALSAVPAAVWIALLGSGLLLAAAIAVVASNWSAIGQSFRVAGLTLVTVGLLYAAERLRSLVPATASVIAHVGTYLVASVPIAALSLFGVTWPLCLAVGGLGLVVATERQAPRWRRVTMHTAQVAGWAMMATGVAALLDTTAGVIAVIAAAVLLATGSHRRSVSLALLAVFSPILTALASAGIGAGTFERAGLIGERLSWSGPVVGIVAAMIIAAIALHRRNNPLIVLAGLSPVIGAVTGLAAIDGDAVAWWCLPALALIALELAVWMLPADRFRREITQAATAVACTVAGLAWCAPLVASVIVSDDFAGPTSWAVPIIATTAALTMATLRWKSQNSKLADLGLASTLATLIATAIALHLPALIIVFVGVIATLAAITLSRTLSPVAIYGTAVWALFTLGSVGTNEGWVQIAVATTLLVALVGSVLAARTRLAAASGPFGWAELTLAGVPVVATAAHLLPGSNATIALGTAAIFALAAVLIDDRLRWWSLMWVASVGAVSADAATAFGTVDGSYFVGWVIAAVSFATLWLTRRSPLMSSAAVVSAVIAAATAAATAGIPAHDFSVMALLITAALTGIAYTFRGHIALDVAAGAMGATLVISSFLPGHAAWISVACLVGAAQLSLGGLAYRSRWAQLGGALGVFGALGSFWFTLGAHDWFVAVIEPLDVRVSDIWMAALVIAAALVGVSLRSTIGVTSWLAYGPSLVISLLWLVSVHVDRTAGWAAPTLLTIGVVAAIAGAWHRMAGPLVGGTVLTIVGAFLAIGSDINSAPTWTWLSLGGVALLSVAVLIERAGRPGSIDLRALIARWD